MVWKNYKEKPEKFRPLIIFDREFPYRGMLMELPETPFSATMIDTLIIYSDPAVYDWDKFRSFIDWRIFSGLWCYANELNLQGEI